MNVIQEPIRYRPPAGGVFDAVTQNRNHKNRELGRRELDNCQQFPDLQTISVVRRFIGETFFYNDAQ